LEHFLFPDIQLGKRKIDRKDRIALCLPLYGDFQAEVALFPLREKGSLLGDLYGGVSRAGQWNFYG